MPGTSNPLNDATGQEKRASCLNEAWVSAPAVDVVTVAARCLGAGKTPLGRLLCKDGQPRATVTMSVLDALWEDRDVRFDVSSQ